MQRRKRQQEQKEEERKKEMKTENERNKNWIHLKWTNVTQVGQAGRQTGNTV